jgi:hypothetical protein
MLCWGHDQKEKKKKIKKIEMYQPHHPPTTDGFSRIAL